MANKKASTKKKALEIKKSLKDFIADEDGYVSKETILKVGLGTIAGIGMLGAMTANAGHTNHPSHANIWSPIPPASVGIPDTCPAYYPDHSNSPGHTSHVSY